MRLNHIKVLEDLKQINIRLAKTVCNNGSLVIEAKILAYGWLRTPWENDLCAPMYSDDKIRLVLFNYKHRIDSNSRSMKIIDIHIKQTGCSYTITATADSPLWRALLSNCHMAKKEVFEGVGPQP